MNESILLDCDGERAAQAVTQVMTRHGLQVMRSFDLRTAPGGHADCACPHHGTAVCTCQYVVLLVYGEAVAPATLTLHSQESVTYLKIVRDANAQPDVRLVEQILAALRETDLQLRASASANAPHLAEKLVAQ
jgi:hypothetical protein